MGRRLGGFGTGCRGPGEAAMEWGVGLRVLERLWGVRSGCEGMGRRSEGPWSGYGTGCEGLGCSGGAAVGGRGVGLRIPEWLRDRLRGTWLWGVWL